MKSLPLFFGRIFGTKCCVGVYYKPVGINPSVKNLFGEEVPTFVIGITHSGEFLVEKVNLWLPLEMGLHKPMRESS